MSRIEPRASNQLAAMQHAVTALESAPEHLDMLTDVIIEMATWHFTHNSPLDSAIELLERAVHLIKTNPTPIKLRRSETLARIHVVLTQMSGNDHAARVEYARIALYYYIKMWSMIIGSKREAVDPGTAGAKKQKVSVSAFKCELFVWIELWP